MIFQPSMSEEEYKQVIYQTFFKKYDYHPNYGRTRIDFVIADPKDQTRHFLWAEAKNEPTTSSVMLTQLILTIKKPYYSAEVDPPAYVAVFDPNELHLYKTGDFVALLNRNDIDWRTPPSKHSDPRFKKLQDLVDGCICAIKTYAMSDKNQINELKSFIQDTFAKQTGEFQGREITLDNLNHIFNKWSDMVKPTIALSPEKWDGWKKQGVFPSDFFLADMYVDPAKDETIADGLQVLIDRVKYSVKVKISQAQMSVLDDDGELSKQIPFTDGGTVYKDFWKRYKRPPRNEPVYEGERTPWTQIVDRRDTLVPRDIMERQGAFFTPRVWVEKAHEAIADALGENWAEEYTVYDCCAGTGNLLAGLQNPKHRIFASDINEQNVRIMKKEIRPELTFESNIFQFDFLNDDCIRQSKGGKVPDALMDVLEDPEKRKRLVFLINPPYAEVSSIGSGGKAGVNISMVHNTYSTVLGTAGREIFVQFIHRIYKEMKGCILAEFSKLKILQGSAFESYRASFFPKLLYCFIAPAETFDNVVGKFPIGFKIWDTNVNEPFSRIKAEVYDANGSFLCNKSIAQVGKNEIISRWLPVKKQVSDSIGFLAGTNGNDFQQNNIVYFINERGQMANPRGLDVSATNMLQAAVYFAVRKSEDATWLNDRDQFLYPKTNPLRNPRFVNDCLIFSIFHGNNHVSVQQGDNHWIPYDEKTLGVTAAPFKHHTLINFLNNRKIPAALSTEAKAVYDSGLEIFQYYHTGDKGKPFRTSPCGKFNYNPDAAFYDIRQFFQGTGNSGRMNTKSADEYYQALIEQLRADLKTLRDKRISPKVYEYGFLL